MNVETELKLAVDEAAIARLNDLPIVRRLQSGPPRTVHLETVYYDTPEYSLFHLRYVLRIRRTGSGFVQTVKRDREGASALTRRSEFEHVLSDETPDRSALPDDPDLDFLRQSDTWDRLEPVVTNTFDRRIWKLNLENGAEIELVADTGLVTAGEKSEPLCELELELKCGTEADLLGVVRGIADSLPVSPESTSKSLRGFRLLGIAPVLPVYSVLPDPEPDASMAELLQQLLRGSVDLIAANRDAVVYSGTAEALHALRAGIRVLRGWLSVFSPCVPAGARPAEMGVLREMMQPLDAAGGLDVLCAEIMNSGAGPSTEADEFERCKSLAGLQYEKALERVRRLLKAPRWGGALAGLICWVELCEWRAALSADAETELLASAEAGLPRLVDRYRSLVLKKGAVVLREETGNLYPLQTLVENLWHAERLLPRICGGEPEPFSGALCTLNRHLAAWRRCAQVNSELVRNERSSGTHAVEQELKALVSLRMKSALGDTRTAWAAFAEEPPLQR